MGFLDLRRGGNRAAMASVRVASACALVPAGRTGDRALPWPPADQSHRNPLAPGAEKRVTAASQHLAADLHSALHRAERLAESAIASPAKSREAALAELSRLVPSAGPEMSVAVFDSSGESWAWAGRHRLLPRAEGDSFAARTSGYYVVLEARRHSAEGRSAVAGVLIWAHPAVPDRNRSLAELFRQRTEVGLAVYPSGTAPESIDVFDYEEPTTSGSRLLFSVQPIPRSRAPPRSWCSSEPAMLCSGCFC